MKFILQPSSQVQFEGTITTSVEESPYSFDIVTNGNLRGEQGAIERLLNEHSREKVAS
ncbi:MAG: hypothetical protein MUO91_03760 [candidate division Zixibacteria bacterium]|nr:hypothetical protein [candidate division Zixibacteria bacterium]